MSKIELEPIGVVESEYTDPKELIFACEKGLKTPTHSAIVLRNELVDGLKGLEEFSHLFVMYFLDKATKLELITHPGTPSMTGMPRVGVFASRSQYRPNHIALRLVKLEKVEGNKVYVEGLDAIDGSRVLDIKPYIKGFDRPENFKIPDWYDWFE